MAHDIFISHSSKDKTIAEAACACLESRGLRCWIAPRDIVAGADWSASIIDGINGARVMVLILSSHANVSKQVLREIERAANRGMAVLPFRIEDIPLSKSLEYFLSSAHWLDAWEGPVKYHLERLANNAAQIVDRQDAVRVITEPAPAKRHFSASMLVAGGLALLLLGGAALLFVVASRQADKRAIQLPQASLTTVGDGSMIQNPKSPADFYHNAKLQELSGRFKDAFESYRRYVEMNEEFVDPCLDYLALVQSQRGHKAAEAEFGDLARKFPDNLAISLAAASLASGPEKRVVLEDFAQAHEDFGPVYWLAAREYSTAVMRAQSAIAVEHERALLEKLVSAEQSGNFSRYFINKKFVAEQLEQAHTRLNEITTKQLGVRMWLGEEDEPWPASSPFGPAGFRPLDEPAYVSIFDGHVKAVCFKLGDTAWTDVPADQIKRLNDRLSSVFWVPQMISLQHAEQTLPDRDAEALIWFKYEDVNGLQSPSVSVFRVRRLAPEGVDPRRALGAKPETELPARNAAP